MKFHHPLAFQLTNDNKGKVRGQQEKQRQVPPLKIELAPFS